MGKRLLASLALSAVVSVAVTPVAAAQSRASEPIGTIVATPGDQGPVVSDEQITRVRMAATIAETVRAVQLAMSAVRADVLRVMAAARSMTDGEQVRGTVQVKAARLRTKPVDGTILRLLDEPSVIWVSCQRRADDGQVWGLVHGSDDGERFEGWMHSSLYRSPTPDRC